MKRLVLSNICSTQITGQRNPSMWMSELQLAKGLSDDSEVVSVDIEQSWQFDKVLVTLDTTLCTNFCFALETAQFGVVSTQTTRAVYHTPKSSTCVHLAHVHQTGRPCYLDVGNFRTKCLLCTDPRSYSNLSWDPLITFLAFTVTKHSPFTKHF